MKPGYPEFASRVDVLPQWPADVALSPDGVVQYAHPAGLVHEVYQLPVSRLLPAVKGAVTSGVAQVETATVVAAAGTTAAGNIAVTVTSALFTPARVVTVAVLDDANFDSATKIADALAAALTLDEVVGAHFSVVNSGADIVATALMAAADDTTLNIAIPAGLGVTAAATSADTTAGVLGTIPDYLGQMSVYNGAVKVATSLRLNTWTAVS